VKLVHGAAAQERDDVEIPEIRPQERRRGREEERGGRPGRRSRDDGEGRPERDRDRSRRQSPAAKRARRDAPSTRLFIGAGRKAGVRPGDLVGAIANEAGVDASEIGAIEIADRFSLVEVPEDMVDDVIGALRATTIKGKRVMVRRDREAEG
jgi:ATP-dependent RNA helicase DeaD